MELLFLLLAQAVIGGICAAVASGRGRNGLGWFFVGFFFGCLPIVILLALPDLKKEQAASERLRNENRRLRETVRKNRLVADTRDEVTGRRLKAHDRALGVDTEDPDFAGELGPVEPPPMIPTAGVGGAFEGFEWFYAVDGERVGPMPFAELCDAWRDGDVLPSTLVWRRGLKDWVTVEALDGLQTALEG
jgi:hypothetical protein